MSFIGLRVVRGLGWKSSDEDGGEGGVGTVVSESDATVYVTEKLTACSLESRERFNLEDAEMIHVIVIWDCTGLKGTYSVYSPFVERKSELRVVDNSCLGVKHPIRCNGPNCSGTTEISGIRWQCLRCKANFCVYCFLQVEKHHHDQDHCLFDCYEHLRAAKQLVWLDSSNRIPLKGIFVGAKVKRGLDWNFGNEDGDSIGKVIDSTIELKRGQVVVRWRASGNSFPYRQSQDGKMDLKVMKKGETQLKTSLDKVESNVVIARDSSIKPFLKVLIAVAIVIIDVIAGIGFLDLLARLIQMLAIFGMPMYFCTPTAILKRKPTTSSMNDATHNKIDILPFLLGWSQDWSTAIIVLILGIGMSGVTLVGIVLTSAIWIIAIFVKKFTKHGKNIHVNDECQESSDEISMEDSNHQETNDEEYHRRIKREMNRYMDDGGLLVKQLEPIQAFPIEVQYDLKKGYALTTEFPALIEQAVTGRDLPLLQNIFKRGEISVNAFNHKSGLNALHMACQKGHVHIIEWFLDNGIDPELCERKKGRSAIHFSVKGCNPGALELLIHKKVDLDQVTTKKRWSALRKAVENKCKICVKFLIEAGCNINLQDWNGLTALHSAILKSNLSGSDFDSVEALVSCKMVNWELSDESGLTAFSLAVQLQNFGIVKYLLDNGGIKLFTQKITGSGFDALHCVCFYQDYKIAKLFVDRIKIVNAVEEPSNSSFLATRRKPLCSKGSLIDPKTKEGITPLLIACATKAITF